MTLAAHDSSLGRINMTDLAASTLTDHEEIVQGILPLLHANIHNSSVVEVPQKVHRGKRSRHGINAKDGLVVQKPSAEIVALRGDAALVRGVNH